jgi:uncharacterized OB-fold protein
VIDMAAQRKISFAGTPDTNPETKPYWDACNEGKLMIQKCLDTGKHYYHPRSLSPFTLSNRTEWVQASGKGKIYTFSVMERANPPFTIAYVTLEEGTTMLTNIVDCDFSKLKIGQDVKVTFIASEEGQKLPFFTPV